MVSRWPRNVAPTDHPPCSAHRPQTHQSSQDAATPPTPVHNTAEGSQAHAVPNVYMVYLWHPGIFITSAGPPVFSRVPAPNFAVIVIVIIVIIIIIVICMNYWVSCETGRLLS